MEEYNLMMSRALDESKSTWCWRKWVCGFSLQAIMTIVNNNEKKNKN